MVLTGGAGSMSITGSLDTSLIESGFRRIKSGFEGVKGQVKGFTSDLFRMDETTASLTKKMKALSLIGATAMLGLASKAPAVAGAMAKIGIQTEKLIRTLGTQFKPEFEKVAELYTNFVSFVEAHPDLTKAFTFGAVALTGITALTGMIKVIAGATVAASFLSGLGYIVAIGAASAVTYTAITKMFDKMKDLTGITDADKGGIPVNVPETMMSRAPEKVASYFTGAPLSWENPCDVNSPGYDRAQCRQDSINRGDAVWGAAPKEESRWDALMNFIDYVSFWD